MVANGYQWVEKDAVRPRNGDAANDIVGAGNLVLLLGLLQLLLLLRQFLFPERASLLLNSLTLFSSHRDRQLLAGPGKNLETDTCV